MQTIEMSNYRGKVRRHGDRPGSITTLPVFRVASMAHRLITADVKADEYSQTCSIEKTQWGHKSGISHYSANGKGGGGGGGRGGGDRASSNRRWMLRPGRCGQRHLTAPAANARN